MPHIPLWMDAVHYDEEPLALLQYHLFSALKFELNMSAVNVMCHVYEDVYCAVQKSRP